MERDTNRRNQIIRALAEKLNSIVDEFDEDTAAWEYRAEIEDAIARVDTGKMCAEEAAREYL